MFSSQSMGAGDALIHLPVILGSYSYLPVANNMRMSTRGLYT